MSQLSAPLMCCIPGSEWVGIQAQLPPYCPCLTAALPWNVETLDFGGQEGCLGPSPQSSIRSCLFSRLEAVSRPHCQGHPVCGQRCERRRGRCPIWPFTHAWREQSCMVSPHNPRGASVGGTCLGICLVPISVEPICGSLLCPIPVHGPFFLPATLPSDPKAAILESASGRFWPRKAILGASLYQGPVGWVSLLAVMCSSWSFIW